KDNVDAVPTQQYILLPLLYDSLQSSKDAVADDAGKKTNEEPANEGERNGYANSTNRDSTVSPSISTAGQNFTNADDLPTDPLIPDLEDTGIKQFWTSSKLDDVEGTNCLTTATIFAELERMGYENLTQKLTFYKAYFSSQ
ncbi:hypothetical protein Tco_1200089, partial [Tanacetum coccineum]